MRSAQGVLNKIFTVEKLMHQITIWKMHNKKIAFTNGVFDILHHGHISSLTEAASFADVLIVGLNSDDSVKRLKGPSRPVNDEKARSLLLASLLQTDAVVIFQEDTPLELIKQLLPDVLVKGGDYTLDQIAGAKEVIASGGEVKIAGMIPGISTTAIIKSMEK